MIDKLEKVERRFEELTTLLGDPDVINNRDRYRECSKEHADLQPLVQSFREWKKASEELASSKELLEEAKDPEMRELAETEVDELNERIESIREELLVHLLPKDPFDDKNIIIEIRAGTGGDEAALFAEELFSMYCRYAESRRWKIEIMNSSASSVGGMKDVTANISGTGAYSCFKYESGVHRVQRVPATETQGRVHTSTVTVAILPEAEDVDVDIQEKDLRIDVFRSSGPGGQSVNTTDSAVRITHLPTNTVVTCQDEKSQHKNKAKAMKVLRARLLEVERARLDAERGDSRRSQIGSGERSEKIRTYNFPQGRITDHRIGLTLYQLDTVMTGELELLVEPLRAHFRTEALQAQGGDLA